MRWLRSRGERRLAAMNAANGDSPAESIDSSSHNFEDQDVKVSLGGRIVGGDFARWTVAVSEVVLVDIPALHRDRFPPAL
jgi:hypothetical protein